MARGRPYPCLAVLLRPLCWPIWVRRLAILAAPFSLPCWAALAIVAFLLDTLAPLGYALNKLWNGKQRRLYRADYYSYTHPDRGSQNTLESASGSPIASEGLAAAE